ncbi:MAG: 3-hydroxyacyl-CoA dehydrogenase NAD-binding domain-containing protein [Pseudomonadota bacterium]
MAHDDILTTAIDADGVATITWDVAERPMNVFSDAAISAFGAAVEALADDESVTGVVIASAKPVFHAGADLVMVQTLFEQSPQQLFDLLMRVCAMFRRLETCGKPVAAAINGHALGGGFEMALAAHARFVADDPKIKLGLPEARLGLMPSFGGTQRLARLIGYQKAVPDMAQGKTYAPQDARKLGTVTDIVPPDELLDRARAWVLSGPEPVQPWDKKGVRPVVPSPGFTQFFSAVSAGGSAETWGVYPAPRLIADAVYHGIQMPIDPALRLEIRRFIELVRDPSSKAMVRTNFFAMKDAAALVRRPTTPPETKLTTIGIIGAGLMGAGIAHAAASGARNVVLIDINQDAAERGKASVQALLDKQVARGRMETAARDAVLERIVPGTDYAALSDCDLVIEAVFEDAGLKHTILSAAEAAMPETAVLASNTSTIPIVQLASVLGRPERFLGLHFFSPVDKMPLVEIIRGAATSDSTLAAGFDLAKLLRKTPIAVNDGRGFYTTRVVKTYMLEGMALLGEGVTPALIENAGRLAGMPMGPLRLVDMVNIDLVDRIDAQTEADLGTAHRVHPGILVARRMVREQARIGEKASAGFYDHADGAARLWPGLQDVFPEADVQPTLDQTTERLMLAQAVEALRCFDDGIVETASDADVGSILGWGFAPQTGGVASYIDHIGPAHLLARCQALESSVGPWFAPSSTLKTLAETGGTLHVA